MAFPEASAMHQLEGIYFDSSDNFCVREVSNGEGLEGVATCNCNITLNHIRSVGRNFVRLISVSPAGLGQPVYHPHTLKELAVSAVATAVLQSNDPEEYEGWMGRILGGDVPRFVYECLLGVQNWGYRYWPSLRKMWVWLRPVVVQPPIDAWSREARMGRHLTPFCVNVYGIREFNRRYRLASNRPA